MEEIELSKTPNSILQITTKYHILALVHLKCHKNLIKAANQFESIKKKRKLVQIYSKPKESKRLAVKPSQCLRPLTMTQTKSQETGRLFRTSNKHYVILEERGNYWRNMRKVCEITQILLSSYRNHLKDRLIA
jgi:hypothetical protein